MGPRSVWLSLVLAIGACGGSSDEEAPASASTGLRFLGGETEGGFARATDAREFAFPRDHGNHPEYRTEWWYFTGNLETGAGRHFGFELTFFRYAIGRIPAQEGISAFRSEQVWMAHLAITDTQGRRFLARERLTREALGLAGSTSEPLRIWVKDWSAVASEPPGGNLSFDLAANDGEMGLSLQLSPTVPPVLQGERGLDRKGAQRGNASYYYSLPRLEVDGAITVEGERFAVTGLAWMDREWGTSSLEPGVAGWDWFALHLSDGSNLMFYRLRLASGGSSAFSGGSLVRANGERIALGAEDVVATPLEHWTSAVSGVRYPVAWRLEAPTVGLKLDVKPYLADQEVALSVRYWEGAVRGVGTGLQGPLTAQGYLELAGY